MVLSLQGFTLVPSLPCRYAAAPHPLLSFDPHFMHDGMSSGDSSSGGLTSQESTMERPKPGKQVRAPIPLPLPKGFFLRRLR